MNDSASLVPQPPDHTAAYEFAMAARLAYDEATASDGVSADSWAVIALDMQRAADGLIGTRALPSQIQCIRDRATDAAHRANYARRMVEHARRLPWIPAIAVEVR